MNQLPDVEVIFEFNGTRKSPANDGEIIVVPSYKDSSLPCLTNPSGAFTSSIR